MYCRRPKPIKTPRLKLLSGRSTRRPLWAAVKLVYLPEENTCSVNRRRFLSSVAAAGAATLLSACRHHGGFRAAGRAPCILLRGSWQSVNIGDIGHTPGAIQMIRRWCPDARIILWAGGVERGAKELIERAFPDVQIIPPDTGPDGRLLYSGTMVDDAGRPTIPALAQAWEEADVMIHGSGSDFGARRHLTAFHRATGKPCGVFGTSVDPISGFGEGRDPEGGTLGDLWRRMEALPPNHLNEETRWIIDRTSFFFARDTLSLDYLRRQGVRPPLLEFGPDTQFGMTLRDDARGDAYREAHGLEEGKFLCVIPRLRYTPYYQIFQRLRNATDHVRDALNERAIEDDHAKLREVIIRYVRTTGHRVMTCPEMTYQIGLAKQMLVDPLPEDVKRRVVWRDTFWLPDEAASIYRQAQAVVSADCHSPIIAVANGTPGLYVRQPTDTCKGQMYPDVGLDDWIFEIEETSGAQLWERLESILRHPTAARAYARAAMDRVEQQQQRMVGALSSIRAA